MTDCKYLRNSATRNRTYLTNAGLREEIAYAVGSDPTRYGRGSDRRLKKSELLSIATLLQPDGSNVTLDRCDLERLYRLVCKWTGGEYQPTAGNAWGLTRSNLKLIHDAVDGRSPREVVA